MAIRLRASEPNVRRVFACRELSCRARAHPRPGTYSFICALGVESSTRGVSTGLVSWRVRLLVWRDVYDARELTADERLTTYLTKLENDQSARTRTVRANHTERGRACPCACAYAQF